jgi:hypothetical protein
MFRFFARIVGFILMAVGFVGLVIDGTRSIANGALSLTPLGEVAFKALPKHFPLIEPGVSRHVHPWLWDPVLLYIFLTPAALLAFGLGLLLIWLGQRPPEPIGFFAGR